MGGEWPIVTLDEAGVRLYDCVHKTPDAVERGIPYIGIPQMKNGHIDFSANPRLISYDDYLEWTKKLNPQKYDVVLSRRCNPGETAIVKENAKFALGQNLVILRSSGTDVIPEFLRWMVQGQYWWAEVERYINVGAVFNSLRCADIPNFRLPLPPLPEQKAIAHILGTLDDKIELNRQMNATLEAMAQALFQSWFVDFDPVIDKALKAGHEIPEPLQARARRRVALGDKRKPLPADVMALFPDRFVETEELGWVPEGWGVVKLGDIVDIKYGKDYKHLNEGNIPMYGSGGIMKHVDAFLYQGESVLIPRKGSLNNLLYVNESFWTVDTMFFTIMKTNFFAKYFFEFIRQFDFVSMNVGSAVPSMTTQVLNQIDVLNPSEKVLETFDTYLNAYNEKKAAIQKESATLTHLRDTLLPKLISGELRVGDVSGQTKRVQV